MDGWGRMLGEREKLEGRKKSRESSGRKGGNNINQLGGCYDRQEQGRKESYLAEACPDCGFLASCKLLHIGPAKPIVIIIRSSTLREARHRSV